MSVIIIVVIAMILSFGCGMILGQQLGNSKNDNDEVKNNNIADYKIVSIEIDDLIRELYNKYHSMENSVVLSFNVVETNIYHSEKYEVYNLNESICNQYQIKIADLTINKLNSGTLNVDDNNKDSLIQKNLEESFKSFLGNKVRYDNKLINCIEFYDDNNSFKYRSNCGDTSSITAKYKLIKAEKDKSNIYLYEDVDIYDENKIKESYTYKWIYDLQEDGNYYFLKAERISSN